MSSPVCTVPFDRSGPAPCSRREFLVRAAALAAAAAFAPSGADGAPHAGPRTRLILLGTAGGPRPRANRAATSQVVLVDGVPHVVDCGEGVATQLVRAGVPLHSLRHVFITHHHSDHNLDYGNLLILSWVSGLRTRVDAWGPPPLDRMTRLFWDLNAADIRLRTSDEGLLPPAPLVHVHERTAAGTVLHADDVTVTSALVDHPPVTPAFAYRFDGPDRSIVISGDTRRSEALVRLADGADVLVHEVMSIPGVDRMVARLPHGGPRLRRSIVAHHTSVEDAGRVAQAAGVGTLVLSHFVPADDDQLTEDAWSEAARSTFGGRVVVGRDLLEV
jgi:ribonuclease BN (tRNA processing enzyme)